jgi:hypothetical protein
MFDCIIPQTLVKGVQNNIYPLQMGPSASMVRRQPRHRHQKDPFVYRGSHACLDRNPRYYRIAITAHLAVIPSFVPFCHQSSTCRLRECECQTCSHWSIHLGLETKFQRSIPHLPVHRPVRFLGYPHEMGSTSGLYSILIAPPRYLRDLLIRNSMSFVLKWTSNL